MRLVTSPWPATAGMSFTITPSSNTDTSTVTWVLLELA
ncbi:hypothetical protein [Streptomyces mesophilus]